MGLRLILTAVTIWLVYLLARNWFRQRQRSRRDHDEAGYRPTVQCARCGTHLPRDEALQHDGLSYCCQAHLEQGPADPAP